MVGLQLEDTVVLVTGGGTGLGLNIARGLYESKAKVACISLEYEANFPKDCLTFKGDIFDQAFLKSCIEQTIEKFGKIDVLINNIGYGTNNSCEYIKIADYDKMFKLNVYSQKYMINYITKYTNARIQKVINISSAFSKAALPTLEAYASTKRAALEVSREIAKLDEHLAVACVCPGYMKHKKHINYFSRKEGQQFLRTRIPMKRVGDPFNELVPAIVMCASPLTRNIKYTELVIDGGLSSYCGKERE